MTTLARHPSMAMADGSGPVRWIHEVRVDGEVTFRRGKLGDRLVAEWPGVARVTCARDGSGAVLVRAKGASEQEIETVEGAPLQALLRDLAGHLALHAAAVVVDGRAVMFLGESGSGKSTAAAEMCLRREAHMLADDTALLEMRTGDVFVLPSEQRHSLTGESCAALGVRKPLETEPDAKHRVRTVRAAAGAYPLTAVFALTFPPGRKDAGVRPLRGTDAARHLLSSVIRFDVEDGEARRRDFEQLAAIYERVPFFELARAVEQPGEVAPFVLDALKKGRT